MSEKVCSRCKESKPLEEFYNNHSSPDGKGWYCKPCHEAVMTQGFTGELAYSTALALDALAKVGIPALARTTSAHCNWEQPAYVDLIAWGIVTIEAKVCLSGQLVWNWNNADPRKDDVVMLADALGDEPVWYVFANDSPVFYHQAKSGRGYRPERVGQRKTGVVISADNQGLFMRAREQWGTIEHYRVRKSRLLRSGELATPEVPEAPCPADAYERAKQVSQLTLWELSNAG